MHADIVSVDPTVRTGVAATAGSRPCGAVPVGEQPPESTEAVKAASNTNVYYRRADSSCGGACLQSAGRWGWSSEQQDSGAVACGHPSVVRGPRGDAAREHRHGESRIVDRSAGPRSPDESLPCPGQTPC